MGSIIGMDPWVGCKWRHTLPSSLVDNLHNVGLFVLSDIGCPDLYLLDNQEWFTTALIGLTDQHDIICWNEYVGLLKTSHVRLSCDKDLLIWNQSKSGKYTPRAGYLQLMLDRQEEELSWWWKVLWKFKCPLKAKKNCWFLLKDKALTWDVLCCKGFEGLGRCYLCKSASKSNVHIGVECFYFEWAFELPKNLPPPGQFLLLSLQH